MIKRECAVCGKEFPEADMEKIFTGRCQYVCLKCYDKGDRNVSTHLMINSMIRRRIKNCKKES